MAKKKKMKVPRGHQPDRGKGIVHRAVTKANEPKPKKRGK